MFWKLKKAQPNQQALVDCVIDELNEILEIVSPKYMKSFRRRYGRNVLIRYFF